MNGQFLAALTRRASPMAMSGAGMMTLTRSVADTKRKNKNNKRKNDNDKKARQKCEQQRDECTISFEAECNDDPQCLDLLLPCCEFAGRCDFTGFLNCVFAPDE